MFGWYRSQISQHGVLNATQLLWQVGLSRTSVNLANRFLPERLSCPCCGWRGRRFYDYIELGCRIPNLVCPRCESHARHRAFFLWLTREYPLQEKSGVALVFAPERALREIWEDAATNLRIFRADIEPTRGTDLLLDLQRIPIADDSVDLVWCHHVLEHIEDDRAAMRELCRVLRPATGELIVSVPMQLGGRTREYGFPDPRDNGHWRLYGDDFVERLTESGLSVSEAGYELDQSERRLYGIIPEPFYVCRKARQASEPGREEVENQRVVSSVSQ